MKITDSFAWGLRGMRQRKLRAALTILGIMIGTAAVIALVSQTQGISDSISGEFSKLGPTTIIITRSSSSTTTLTQIDVNRISQLPGVSLAIPMIETQAKVFGNQGQRTFTLIGVDPAQFAEIAPGYKISQGRMFQTISYGEVIVGAYAYQPQDLTSSFVNVGQSVTVQLGGSQTTKLMVIVGSLQTYGATPLISVDSSIFMPIQGLASILGTQSYSIILVQADNPSSVTSVADNIRAVYGNSLSIITVQEITQVVGAITGLLTVLLGGIAGISLFVAGVGITNIMFVSVIERTREIGVLKALGFKSRDVLSIFLSEAALLGVVGGILGIVVGAGISYLLPILISIGVGSSFGGSSSSSSSGGGAFGGGSSAAGTTSFSYTPVISPEVVLMVLGFAIAVSLLAGLYPARRASKMDPVVALRHE